jgi:EAL domain-containing protein (putative c-di-GMP-specific phosphodiesterase class I)
MARPLHRDDLIQIFETGDAPDPGLDSVTRILKAMRSHLGMDVAFASEVADGEVAIRRLDCEPGGPIHVGQVFAAEESYCQRIIDGRLPGLIPDTAKEQEAAALACTKVVPVGAHLSVPIRLSDGRIYGAFCCFSFTANRSLNRRDLQTIRAFAELAAGEIDRELAEAGTHSQLVANVRDVIDRDRIRTVFQPIYRLDDGSVAGVECLARFPDCEIRPPNEWFREAASVGLGTELEMAVFRQVLAAVPYLPESLYIAVNFSPATILSSAFAPAFAELPPGRFILEVTENQQIGDYVAFARALVPLRRRARIAIDDVGAGYSGMRHILDLAPEIIKLDMSLVRDIDKDPARRSLALALVAFASEIGSLIVAEGVETPAELAVLRDLGIPRAQGYHLGRPMPLMALLQFLNGDREQAAPPSRPQRPSPARPRRAFP